MRVSRVFRAPTLRPRRCLCRRGCQPCVEHRGSRDWWAREHSRIARRLKRHGRSRPRGRIYLATATQPSTRRLRPSRHNKRNRRTTLTWVPARCGRGSLSAQAVWCRCGFRRVLLDVGAQIKWSLVRTSATPKGTRLVSTRRRLRLRIGTGRIRHRLASRPVPEPVRRLGSNRARAILALM